MTRNLTLTLAAAVVLACVGQAPNAAIIISADNANLLPNTPNQAVAVTVVTDANDQVAGINLNGAIGDGTGAGLEPVFQGPGPLTGVDFPNSFWTFPNSPGGTTPNGTFPQFATSNNIFEILNP